MGFLIDTGPLIDLERGTSDFGTLLARVENEPLFLAAVTASELLHGVHRADSAVRRGRREKFVEWVLDRIPTLPFDLEVARFYAQIWADLVKQRRRIGAHDTMIAATALAHGLTVLTTNGKDFGNVEGLSVFVWKADPAAT